MCIRDTINSIYALQNFPRTHRQRVGPIHRARILALSNPYFHIIKYAYSFHRKRISVRHFVDIYGYAGTINRPLRLLTVCQQRCWRIGIIWQIFCEIFTFTHEMRATNYNNITFKKQKPYFCNAKTPFLHAKNHTFTRQKPYFCFADM